MSLNTSKKSSKLSRSYFDLTILRMPAQPEQGKLILTLQGKLLRCVNGDITLDPITYIRLRQAEGQAMLAKDEAKWMSYGLQWLEYYTASFLEYVHTHQDEFEELIQLAPDDFKLKIQRLSKQEPGNLAPVAWLAPKHLSTPANFNPLLA